MAGILDFSRYAQDPDLDGMDCEALQDYLKSVRAQLDQLSTREPENTDSEEYEVWSDLHEELAALSDEIRDVLSEMGGGYG